MNESVLANSACAPFLTLNSAIAAALYSNKSFFVVLRKHFRLFFYKYVLRFDYFIEMFEIYTKEIFPFVMISFLIY